MLTAGKLYTVGANGSGLHVYDWRGTTKVDDEKECGKRENLHLGELVMVLEFLELPDGFRAKFLREDGTMKYLRVVEGPNPNSMLNRLLTNYFHEVIR